MSACRRRSGSVRKLAGEGGIQGVREGDPAFPRSRAHRLLDLVDERFQDDLSGPELILPASSRASSPTSPTRDWMSWTTSRMFSA